MCCVLKEVEFMSFIRELYQEELFVLGFKLGLRLGKEVWEEDPIKRMEEKICR